MNNLKRLAHEIAVSKGFWDGDRNETELIMLVVTELAETVEALRHGNPKSKVIKGFSQVEEELADAMLRILDLCKAKNYDIEGAIWAKMEYNKKRPRMHGGKKF